MQDIKTFAQLKALTLGQPIELTCKRKIEDLEAYPDENMRLTLYTIQDDGNEVMKLHVSYELYDEYNKQFENHTYFDKNHRPCLNAREAGYYKINDILYVMANDNPHDYFSVLNVSKAYNYWLAVSEPGQTYIQWLESIVEQKLKL